MDHEQFLRTEMLLGSPAMERLRQSHVAVFGIGGVGSWCAEALARAGIGQLTLVDHDQVGLTNLNRQAEALHSTLGLEKTAAMAQRIQDINPNCILHLIPEKYEAANRDQFFRLPYDYIVDAIDLVSCKLDLIETARSRSIPILSSMGTGNKLDPSQFRVADLSQTQGCPLARVLRKELRKRGILHHKVVFSPELPAPTTQGRHPRPAGALSLPAPRGFLPWRAFCWQALSYKISLQNKMALLWQTMPEEGFCFETINFLDSRRHGRRRSGNRQRILRRWGRDGAGAPAHVSMCPGPAACLCQFRSHHLSPVRPVRYYLLYEGPSGPDGGTPLPGRRTHRRAHRRKNL